MMATPSAPTAPRVRGLALPMRAARRRGLAGTRQPGSARAGRGGACGGPGLARGRAPPGRRWREQVRRGRRDAARAGALTRAR